jgi:endonuclease/exonuclease/phosphatase (EEP) superfamily protein YafD
MKQRIITARIRNVFFLILILPLFVSISCRGKGTSQVSEFPQKDQTLPATITIVNWNAQKVQDRQFIPDLKRIFETHNPDIVFLQEARADRIELEKMGGYFAKSWSYPWPGGATVGVLTFSKIPPLRIEPVQTKYREFSVTAPKVSLVTEYPLPDGKTLLAVNVHLLNFEFEEFKKLRTQLETLKAIMERHSGPIIMAGDFNTWNRKRLQMVKKITGDLKLIEATEFPDGRTTGGLNSDYWNTSFGIETDLPLDRVYYSGYSVDAAWILPYASSDHKPIAVTLSLTR